MSTETGGAVYYLWNSHYTGETLMKEAEHSGCGVCGLYGDVAGSPYDEKSPAISILLERP